MQRPVVIFDFDGTIANTLDSIIDIMNNLSEDFRFRKIRDEDKEYLRGKRPREILNHLGISLFKLPFVIRKVRREINSHIALLSPSVDLLPALKLLKKNKCQLGIVTTNIEENVRKFLHANNLDQFDLFYTSKKIFGKDKTISKIIRDMKLEKSNVYFVGDEVRDIEAGKKAGVNTIAVSWGYNTKEALAKENPEFLIDSPDDIGKIILKKEKKY
ncbi:MAG: HAD-IA family hydrolase [Candidatus Nitrosomaritimum yanchengensis]